MDPETPAIDYSLVLADLEAKLAGLETKRIELEAAIAAVKRILGYADSEIVSSVTAPQPDPIVGSQPSNNSQAEEIPDDAFFSMTMVDATKKYLRMVKKKKVTKEIAQALERGGFAHESKNFYVTLWNVLNRESKNLGSDIIKIKTAWALTEWYPDRRKKLEG